MDSSWGSLKPPDLTLLPICPAEALKLHWHGLPPDRLVSQAGVCVCVYTCVHRHEYACETVCVVKVHVQPCV